MCIKCDKRLQLLELGDAARNVWSGRLQPYPEKVWFDASKALKYLAELPAAAVAAMTAHVPTAGLWETQVSKSEVVVEHLNHVNTAAPVILITTHYDEFRRPWLSLIDGNHRVARAHRDGVPTVPAIAFDVEFSRSLMLPAREMVWEELFAEIEATGGRVSVHGGVILAVGGRPAPQTPDDHPYRAEALKMIQPASGISVFNLK